MTDTPTTQASRHDEAREASRDAGSTFVEIVISVVLVGTVVIGMLAATRASIRSSEVSRDAARVESALLIAVDRVERASREDSPTFRCDLSGPVYAAVQVEFGVSGVDAQNYATISDEHLSNTGWMSGLCPGVDAANPSGVFEPNLVQRITITLESPDTGLTRELTVLKGDTNGTP